MCASLVRTAVNASAPSPPSFTATIAIESNAISVLESAASETPTLNTFGVLKKLVGTLNDLVSDAPLPSVYEVSSVIPSPVNLKYGSVKFVAVAVSVKVPLGSGLLPLPS